MPSKTAAITPPAPEQPKKPVVPKVEVPPELPPAPDVTTWAEKLNARVEKPWEEHELRGGRAFPMPGATMAEAHELCDVFKLWSTGICVVDGSPCILIKPSANTTMPRPKLGGKPGR